MLQLIDIRDWRSLTELLFMTLYLEHGPAELVPPSILQWRVRLMLNSKLGGEFSIVAFHEDEIVRRHEQLTRLRANLLGRLCL
jgi:hypothetical protein